MKIKALLLSLTLSATLLVGCGTTEAPADVPAEEQTDVVTTASLVTEGDAFVNAIGAGGTWIICPLNDLTIDEELVVEGEFHNKNDEAQDLYRKIGLYAQDADHNVTERYILTAPKMTVKSPNTRIQGGTFVGDVYVEAEGFNLRDAKVEGNIYFASEDLKASFATEEAEVTGVTEVKGADVVTTASLVTEGDAFVKAIGADGTWIICPLNDLTIDGELVLEGEFHNKNDEAQDLYRKIGLYAQDADHNVTDRYTLTAPKLTIKSPNTRIQGGTFVGDIYVEAEGFNLRDAKVEGNIYFASEDLKASFATEEAEVTGVTEVK